MSGIVGQNLGRGSGLIKAGAIDDDSVTLAKMAGLARGKLIYGDASGDPAALAVGGADEVLTHDGTDFDWAAASGAVTAINNATENELVTIGATTTELEAEAKLLFNGTDMTIGDATAEDISIIFDGNAADFVIGLDDSEDGLYIGTGGNVPNSALCIDSNNNLTVGSHLAVGSATPFMIRGDSSSNTGQQTARVMNVGLVFNEVRSGMESVWAIGPDGTTFVCSNCTDDPSVNAFQISQSEVVSGDFNDTSDVALKENIVSIDTAIDTVKQLRPVNFDWKRGGKGSTSGFIAQEVELLLPDVVKGENFDSSDRTSIGKALNATGVLAHVTKALQESITKIETLEAKVTALENA
jgi:hypothetical protein